MPEESEILSSSTDNIQQGMKIQTRFAWQPSVDVRPKCQTRKTERERLVTEKIKNDTIEY